MFGESEQTVMDKTLEDGALTEPSDSLDYEKTFYGILNKQGQFWSPMPFDSEQAAMERLARFKGAHLERTHRIVPVRIRLDAIAQPSPVHPIIERTNHENLSQCAA